MTPSGQTSGDNQGKKDWKFQKFSIEEVVKNFGNRNFSEATGSEPTTQG